MKITLNGKSIELDADFTIAGLVENRSLNPRQIAVELNHELIRREDYQQVQLSDGDCVELVSSRWWIMSLAKPDQVDDSQDASNAPSENGTADNRVNPDDSFRVGQHLLSSRLILGTGRYESFELMKESLAVSGTECVTVAVRRERLYDGEGRNILDFLDIDRFVLLPNTAGCYDAETAVRCARMGREILRGLENPGADWVKLEVLGDSKTLLPDPVETIKATEVLVKEGFQVLCYTSDDPITAVRLKAAGATSVMPAGSPIGSGQGILNPNNLKIILEYLKEDDPLYPVIIDAGVGTASDVAQAMELGADGVLLNTAIAHARDPVQMAMAMKAGIEAGRLSYRAGRIPKQLYASASSPEEGVISTRPY